MFRGRVAFDYETTGLNAYKGDKPFMLGMEDEAGKVVLAERGTREYAKCLKVLADPKVDKIGWNAKFDMTMAKVHDVEVRGDVHDGMLLTFMNNEYEPSLKLKNVAHRHLSMPPDEETDVKKELTRLRRKLGREPNYSDVPRRMMHRYLEGDLDRTMKMFWKLEHVITGPQRRVYEIEKRIIPNVVKIEHHGIPVDVRYCKKMLKQFKPRLAKAKEAMFDEAGALFNPNSNAQLTDILRDSGVETGRENKDGTMKTGQKDLAPFSDVPIVQKLLEFRALSKLGTTYFESFLKHEVDGVIHPSFWPFGQDQGIKTGRFSSSDPNFQNIPGGGRGENQEMLKDPGLVRRAVVPKPGYAFLFGDFDQIEFKFFVCNVGDLGLIKDLLRGVDYHTANAYRIFGRNCMDGKSKEEIKRIRHQAKELNFSFIFGMGAATHAYRAGITIQEARKQKMTYFNEVPSARDFMVQSQAALLRDGYVQDQFGRRYHVPRDLCYKATNALCQGPAALVMKRAINNVFDKCRGFDAHPFITVHDELGIMVRKEQVFEFAPVFKKAMEDRSSFAVPMTVSLSVTDTNWADKKDWEEDKSKWKRMSMRR